VLRRGREKKSKQQLARIGEEHAARFLSSRGYKIKDRNFRAAGGAEIDIVAEQEGVLAFVEVKARSSTEFAQPRESVTPWKRRQIARAAAAYIASRERRERRTRFDVVEVLLTPGGRVERVDLIAGAFEAG
jgi:putative endonuclease